MARAKTNKLYRTFTKGLITEASPLTYPEDASIDELNTVISRKGNRTRRVGIEYQSGYVFEDLGLNNTKAVNEFVWLSANNNPLKSFLIVQVGTKLNFYTIGEGPISDNLHAYSLDLQDYKVPAATVTQLHTEFASFSSGAGFLFVAHKYCDPISVEYDEANDTFKPVRIIIQIRDFEGLNDGLPNDAEPYTLSKEHLYNLRNQGWVGAGSSATAASGNLIDTSVESFDPYTGEFVRFGQNNAELIDTQEQ